MPESAPLPRVRAMDPVVKPGGTPTGAFVRFWDTFCKTVEGIFTTIAEINARQDETDANLQDQIDRINRILAGEEEFSGLNVGGQDVKPFLDKTDGAALVNPTGLAAGLVDTERLSITAIRTGAPATNTMEVSIAGLDDVGGDPNAPGASTIVETTFALAASGEVTIQFSCSLAFFINQTIEMALLIDYAGVDSMNAIRDVEPIDPTRYRIINQPDSAGGPASVSIVSAQNLAAGSHSILLLVMSQGADDQVIIPAGSANVAVFTR